VHVAAGVAGGGDVGLAALPYTCMATDAGYEDRAAFSADALPDFPGEPCARSHGYSFEEPRVASAELGVPGVDVFGLFVEDAYSLLGDALPGAAHVRGVWFRILFIKV